MGQRTLTYSRVFCLLNMNFYFFIESVFYGRSSGKHRDFKTKNT